MMETKDDMKQRADELLEQFIEHTQGALDAAKTYYEECGRVNGMDWTHEMCKLHQRLQDQVTMMSKINERVQRHLDEVTDDREFKINKLHQKPTEDELDKLSVADPSVVLPRLNKRVKIPRLRQ